MNNKENKKLTKDKEANFVAIDVETTGLSPVYNELIEL